MAAMICQEIFALRINKTLVSHGGNLINVFLMCKMRGPDTGFDENVDQMHGSLIDKDYRIFSISIDNRMGPSIIRD